MKLNEHVIAEAIRLEYNETTGQLFIVFEITDSLHKLDIKKNWVKDIEFRLVDKLLVKEKE